MTPRLLYHVTLSPFEILGIRVVASEAVPHDEARACSAWLDDKGRSFEANVDFRNLGRVVLRWRARGIDAARVDLAAAGDIAHAALFPGQDHHRDRRCLAAFHHALEKLALRRSDKRPLLPLHDLPTARPAILTLDNGNRHGPRHAAFDALLAALLLAFVDRTEREQARERNRLGWDINPHELRVYQDAVDEARLRIEADIPRLDRQARTLLLAIRDRFLDPDVNMQVLLRDLRISKNQIRPAFRLGTGVKPSEYIRMRRFDVAMRLLRGTGLEVCRVARLVGYDNYRCFGRAFRDATGFTPTGYARGLRVGDCRG